MPWSWSGITSLCHPWAAGPAYWMSLNLVGVRPLAPGFSAFAVAPWASASLPVVEGTVPTVRGAFHVSVNLGARTLNTTIPPVRVPSRSISPPWGSIRFRLEPCTYNAPPMVRTCGEPDEIKKNTHPTYTTALCFTVQGVAPGSGRIGIPLLAGEALVSLTHVLDRVQQQQQQQQQDGHGHGHGHGHAHAPQPAVGADGGVSQQTHTHWVDGIGAGDHSFTWEVRRAGPIKPNEGGGGGGGGGKGSYEAERERVLAAPPPAYGPAVYAAKFVRKDVVTSGDWRKAGCATASGVIKRGVGS